jgi:hypothetical protein
MAIDFTSHFILHLIPFFDRFGYELLLPKHQFRKSQPNGFQMIIPALSVYEEVCLVELNLGVRLDAVEEFVGQFTNILQMNRADTATLLTSMGRLQGKKYLRFQIKDLQELNSVCLQVQDFMEDKGFEFLDQAMELAYLDVLINGQSHIPSPYIYNQTYRCMRGLYIAKLNQNPSYQRIVQDYKTLVAQSNATDQQRKAFERICQYLEVFSVN